MPDRTWFYAAAGQQQGPFSESQFRDLIAKGSVGADTLVWTEGMTGWQRAGDVPGLVTGGPPNLPSPGLSTPGFPQVSGDVVAGGNVAGTSVSIEIGIWDIIWRGLVFVIGAILIIPLPWVTVMYCRWIVSCLRVPDRPHLEFTGRAVSLMWYYAFIVVAIAAAFLQTQWLNSIISLVQLVLYWLLIRWFVANIASDGQPLGLRFTGSFWGYLGWTLLFVLSFITVIGWAWAYTAQLRWMCRHVEGTRRAIIYRGTGWGLLWRAIVASLACVFIIPIPWIWRWLMKWKLSQCELVPR